MWNLQGSIDVASHGRSAQAPLNRRRLSCDRRRLHDYSVTSRRRRASPVPVTTTISPATAPRTPSVEPTPCAIGAVPPPPACTAPMGTVPMSLTARTLVARTLTCRVAWTVPLGPLPLLEPPLPEPP